MGRFGFVAYPAHFLLLFVKGVGPALGFGFFGDFKFLFCFVPGC